MRSATRLLLSVFIGSAAYVPHAYAQKFFPLQGRAPAAVSSDPAPARELSSASSQEPKFFPLNNATRQSGAARPRNILPLSAEPGAKLPQEGDNPILAIFSAE